MLNLIRHSFEIVLFVSPTTISKPFCAKASMILIAILPAPKILIFKSLDISLNNPFFPNTSLITPANSENQEGCLFLQTLQILSCSKLSKSAFLIKTVFIFFRSFRNYWIFRLFFIVPYNNKSFLSPLRYINYR